MTTKLVRFLIYSFAFLSAWLLALNEIIPVPEAFAEFIPALPLWVIVSFGAYSLASIGWSLITFGDCPEAHAELLKEIAQARDELRRAKITIDD
ncbi:dolichol-phosphate mannosyltransferase subunit 3 [Catenaria anguillulae PL171]|nr:dolichol-phosphate mannosyltransferase subunit 3 [Catenaria anguillulae PL171]